MLNSLSGGKKQKKPQATDYAHGFTKYYKNATKPSAQPLIPVSPPPIPAEFCRLGHENSLTIA